LSLKDSGEDGDCGVNGKKIWLRGEDESRGNGGKVIAAVLATFVVTSGKNGAVYFASFAEYTGGYAEGCVWKQSV
jgi:hypothetical protein